MNYTAWFDGSQKPVRDGVYQRQTASGSLFWSRWYKGRWGVLSVLHDTAARCEVPSSEPCLLWRGILK